MTAITPLSTADLLLHRVLVGYGTWAEDGALMEWALAHGANPNGLIDGTLLPSASWNLPEDEEIHADYGKAPTGAPLDRLLHAWCQNPSSGGPGFRRAWARLREVGACSLQPDTWRKWLESREEKSDERRKDSDFLFQELRGLNLPMEPRPPHKNDDEPPFSTLIDEVLYDNLSEDDVWHRAHRLHQDLGAPFHAPDILPSITSWLFYSSLSQDATELWLRNCEDQLGAEGLSRIQNSNRGSKMVDPEDHEQGPWSPVGWLTHELLGQGGGTGPLTEYLGDESIQFFTRILARWDALGVDWNRPCREGTSETPLDLLRKAQQEDRLIAFPFLTDLITRHAIDAGTPESKRIGPRPRM